MESRNRINLGLVMDMKNKEWAHTRTTPSWPIRE